MKTEATRSPWAWIPTLYSTQAFPNEIVVNVSTFLLVAYGIANAQITFWTSLIGLAWAVKGLWSPLIERYFTKRQWVIGTQIVSAGISFLIAMEIQTEFYFFEMMIGLFALFAINSASHDIAADGFYMDALDTHEQSFFSGLRNAFFRVGIIVVSGGVLMLVGIFEQKLGVEKLQAWQLVFICLGVLFLVMAIYHAYILPKPAIEKSQHETSSKATFKDVFFSFIKLPGIVSGLLFILFYRFAEAQLQKIAGIFLIATHEQGGLALNELQIGTLKGTLGTVALLAGGILGGWLVSRHGLKKWLWPMVFAMNIPNILYVYLAIFQPQNIYEISACVIIEQFGYGFGFTAFMLYMLSLVQESTYRSAHYAILTGFMALGMVIPGMVSGQIQTMVGYSIFFIWVIICTLPSFITAYFIKFPSDFGLKK